MTRITHEVSPGRRDLFRIQNGAKGRNRTVDTALFRRVLYQLSYLGSMSPSASFATMRSTPSSTLMGLEPTTFAVTGRRSNQLSYSAKSRHCRLVVGTAGLEPATPRV